jgi:hypothetical protein
LFKREGLPIPKIEPTEKGRIIPAGGAPVNSKMAGEPLAHLFNSQGHLKLPSELPSSTDKVSWDMEIKDLDEDFDNEEIVDLKMGVDLTARPDKFDFEAVFEQQFAELSAALPDVDENELRTMALEETEALERSFDSQKATAIVRKKFSKKKKRKTRLEKMEDDTFAVAKKDRGETEFIDMVLDELRAVVYKAANDKKNFTGNWEFMLDTVSDIAKGLQQHTQIAPFLDSLYGAAYQGQRQQYKDVGLHLIKQKMKMYGYSDVYEPRDSLKIFG